MQANPDIEEGTKTSMTVKAFRVKGSKVFVKIKDPKLALSDTATLDIDNPTITEHMGQKFVELVTEEAEVIFVPLERFNEIKQWAKEQTKKREVEKDARNTQDKPGSAVLPTKESGKPNQE